MKNLLMVAFLINAISFLFVGCIFQVPYETAKLSYVVYNFDKVEITYTNDFGSVKKVDSYGEFKRVYIVSKDVKYYLKVERDPVNLGYVEVKIYMNDELQFEETCLDEKCEIIFNGVIKWNLKILKN